MNERKFDGKGEIYSASRPQYPSALFDYLKKHDIITAQSTVADVGSGTGIFSRQLAEIAGKVFAVEPNKSMRFAAESSFQSYGNIFSVNGTAENTGLADRSVDCVTAAQAFHWFDRKAFAAECKRILKPDGNVVILWNNRDMNSDIIRENKEINSKCCPNFKGFSGEMNFDNDNQFNEFFSDGFIKIAFQNPARYDLNAFIGRNLSSSYAPIDSAEQEKYITLLTEAFNKFSINGFVEYPYITECYIGKV